MMNSQEKKVDLNSQETEKVDKALTSDTEKQGSVFQTKEEIIGQLKTLLENAESTNKQELDTLKQVFYKLHSEEIATQKEEFIKNGGEEADFKPQNEPLEEELKSLIDGVKAKRRELAKQNEALKKENLKKKEAILEKIKSFTESPDEANSSYREFKELQDQWNKIRPIPQSAVNELWRTYQHYVEQFYDMLKLNNEFRIYDFKKNLELKTNLCVAAEELDKEENVISAFHQLQRFHQKWREIGPVEKELREELWGRFRDASTVVNKKHQAHFESLKAEEENNLVEKKAICVTIESIDYTKLNNYNTWNDKTKEVLALQDKWRTIGFAPRRMNVKIFERYRKACDVFFNKKAEHFKAQKNEMIENLRKKEQLCEKAEAVKESTDWRQTSSYLINLQKEWKEIGPVHRRNSDSIWKRFNAACDTFFEARNKQFDKQRTVESDNLKAKELVISKLKELTAEEEQATQANTDIHELIKEWNSIGHVPFKIKDRIYQEYRNLIDKHFNRVNKAEPKRKMKNFKNVVESIQEGGNQQSLYREREKLVRIADRLKGELQTYENNLGFLTLSSKKGGTLIDEINQKVERLKEEVRVVNEKIKVIDKTIFD